MHHAILLLGAAPDALITAAYNRASTALQSHKTPDAHPDCHILNNDGKEITVALTRAWRDAAAYRPNESDTHVFIMHEADKMNAAAQNALLSLLEEPPTPCLFILLAKRKDALLPTILSRVRIETINGGANDYPEAAVQWAQSIFSALNNELILLKQLLFVEKLPRAEVALYLECLLEQMRGNIRQHAPIIPHVRHARAILDNNVNNGMALAALAAQISNTIA